MTPQEFAQKVKEKYPQYSGVDDIELAKKVVQKYPQYASQVNFSLGVEKPQGFLREAGGDIKEAFSGAVEGVTEGLETAEQIKERVTKGETTPISGTFQTIGAGLKAGARAVGEGVIGLGKAVLPQKAEEAIGGVVEKGAKAIVQTEPVQRLIEKYNQLEPEAKRNVDATLGVAEGLGTILGAGPVAAAVRGASRTAITETVRGTQQAYKATKEGIQYATPNIVRAKIASLNPQGREQAITVLTKNYQDALVENKKSVVSKLESMSRKYGTKKSPITVEVLVRNLAEEGYMPIVNGRLASMSHVLQDLQTRRGLIVKNQVTPALAKVKERFSLDGLKQNADEVIRKDTSGADLKKSLAENERIFDSYKEKFGGDDITAAQVDEIRVDMNKRTGAFDREMFEQDVANQIRRVAKEKVDKVAPATVAAREEMERLFRLEEVATLLDNQPINIGVLGSQMGRFAGAAALGATGVATGSGALVMAGVAAHYGGEVVAQFLRNRKFSPGLKEQLIKEVNQVPKLAERLIQEAPQADKKFLRDLFTSGIGVLGAYTLTGDTIDRQQTQ